MIEYFFLFYRNFKGKLRSLLLSLLSQKSLSHVGRSFRFHGWQFINIRSGLRVGDNCWVEAVKHYGTQVFSPELEFGHCVMMSNNVHISCVGKIIIDDFSLIGSNVYIGDHSHGSLTRGKFEIDIPPYQRSLDDIDSIYIGKNTWIGDGAVILAGSYICDGCVVGANAVVKGKYMSPCVIAGVPAKVVKPLI